MKAITITIYIVHRYTGESYGNALIPFINKFPMDTELYKLITTRPGEGVFAKGQVDFDA